MTSYHMLFLAVYVIMARAADCTTSESCENLDGQKLNLLQVDLALRSAAVENDAPAKAPAEQPCKTAEQADWQLKGANGDRNSKESEWVKGADAMASEQTDCMPKCRWSCTSPVCEKKCEPNCLKPECQTRCADTSVLTLQDAGCKFTCKKPSCEVQCPTTGCGGSTCAKCKTVCHQPSCSLGGCSAPCEQVCKEPKCNWNCTDPTDCPQPECKMTCSAPNGCMKIGENLPPLKKGMVVIDDFEPAANTSLLQTGNTRTMSAKALKVVEVPATAELQAVIESITLPVA